MKRVTKLIAELDALEANYHNLVDADQTIAKKVKELARATVAELQVLSERVAKLEPEVIPQPDAGQQSPGTDAQTDSAPAGGAVAGTNTAAATANAGDGARQAPGSSLAGDEAPGR